MSTDVGPRVRTAAARAPGQDRNAEALLALAMEMSSSLDPQVVIDTILRDGARLVAADRATLSSWRDGQLTVEGSVGGPEGLAWVGRSYDASWVAEQPLVREAIASRAVVIGGGLDAGRAAPEFHDALASVRHTATVPILESDELTGLLVFSRRRDPAFHEDERVSLSTLGAIAGLALRNAKIHRDATDAVHHLDAAQRTKSELLDIAVHELRSPLTVIQGYASLLEAGDLGKLEGTALKAVRVIATKACEAQEIATSLLTVARLESNELRIERAATPLPALLEAVRDRVGPRLDLDGATLTLDCPAGLAALADADLVTRIMDNLVNNALIYSAPPAAISITAGPGVEIRVSDRGPGVKEADRERIFERFVRGAGAERAAGTGLGLYVSRECARRMGGDLVLESSRPGEGSTFLLCLPAV
ncbi:MAG: GAF domain-containing sensor histidine kinase [Candidatus Dormibacteria bacterium]